MVLYVGSRMKRLAKLGAFLALVSVSVHSAGAAKPGDVPKERTLDEQLFDAAKDEDASAVEAALSAGANINARSERGMQTPLMQSVLFGREAMVELFLKKGADATIGEKQGYTPMHGAGFQGRSKIAKILFDNGVGLRDKHPEDGHEPAIRACWGPDKRHTETVKFFLENGVPVGDIYDTCMEAAKFEGTKALLQAWKDASVATADEL